MVFCSNILVKKVTTFDCVVDPCGFEATSGGSVSGKEEFENSNCLKFVSSFLYWGKEKYNRSIYCIFSGRKRRKMEKISKAKNFLKEKKEKKMLGFKKYSSSVLEFCCFVEMSQINNRL